MPFSMKNMSPASASLQCEFRRDAPRSSKKPVHNLMDPGPHSGLGGGSKQASYSAFGDVSKRSPRLFNDDWIWLIRKLSLKGRDLGFRSLPLLRIKVQLIDVRSQFRYEVAQIRNILSAIRDRLILRGMHASLL